MILSDYGEKTVVLVPFELLLGAEGLRELRRPTGPRLTCNHTRTEGFQLKCAV